MLIEIQPRGFNAQTIPIPGPDGAPVEGHRFTIIDQTGIAVAVTFVKEDWEAFQRYVADPEGESARQVARARITAPGGLSPTLKTKH